MGGERLDIVNLCCKKEGEKCGNNVFPGFLLLADHVILPLFCCCRAHLISWVVFLFHPGNDEPVQATFIARLEVRKW